MIVKVKKINTKLLTKDKYCKEDIIVQIDQSLVSPDIPTGTAEITTTEKVNVAPYEYAQVVDENLVAENIASGKTILGIDGTFSQDTTATADDILIGKTAYSKGEKITGTYKATTFKKYLDANKSAYRLFYYSKITDFTDYISYEDTSNVTDINGMFLHSKATIIPPLDTRKVANAPEVFSNCSNLITISELDFISVTYCYNIFYNCKQLTNLKILNINMSLQVGSGTSWGHLLTLDSLIGLCQECIKRYNSGQTATLTVGTANLEKLANVYVKITDSTEIKKLPMVQCESTDEGAMTIEAYMALKYWKLA